jgi:hypothetical protein
MNCISGKGLQPFGVRIISFPKGIAFYRDQSMVFQSEHYAPANEIAVLPGCPIIFPRVVIDSLFAQMFTHGAIDNCLATHQIATRNYFSISLSGYFASLTRLPVGYLGLVSKLHVDIM